MEKLGETEVDALRVQLSVIIAGLNRAVDDRSIISEIQKTTYDIRADLSGHRSEMAGIRDRIEELRASMDSYENRCNTKERVQAEHSTTINGILRALHGDHNDKGIVRRVQELETSQSNQTAEFQKAEAVRAGKMAVLVSAGGILGGVASFAASHLQGLFGK
jgi:chromosome segregation ATPase